MLPSTVASIDRFEDWNCEGWTMGKQQFAASLAAGGAHHRLVRMAGEWQGTTKVWFGPEQLADESPQRGSIRVVAGGRFMLHEYDGAFQGESQQGVALYGVHLDANACEIAWVDSFHTGTSILFSSSPAAAGRFAALGSYDDGAGGPSWGWRTSIDQPDADHLVIRMFNIPPQDEEVLAVETCYTRVQA